MKKLLTVSAIVFILAISIFGFITNNNNNLPKKVPIPLITYNNLEIETVPGLYTWVAKGSGGNSNLGPEPEEGVKYIEPVIIEPNGKICFSFDTPLNPKNISLIHWKNRQVASEKTFEEIKEGFFYVPNETGIYVYELNGEWDEDHTSAFSFKIEVK